jgi:uncharacterized circularly permuted ATP-grasp superfamily protein/uncharacterized alpha-E superfamily protein
MPDVVRDALDGGALAGLPDLLRGYRVPLGHYDELVAADTHPRPHWAAFTRHAGQLGSRELSRAEKRVARQLHENGVTYNVHSTAGTARPWALDVLPHIVTVDEWSALTSGLRQRARLLELIAADLYGDQTLVREGRLPAALVFRHPGFLRPCHGVRPPSGIRIHLLAFDIARGLDGTWKVVATRTQAPSGAGYTLENRLTVSRIFPDAFRDLHVCLLAPFFRTLQETLLEHAPCPNGTPHIVLLTPGPYNETYFEHAYLSRYLGFTLAEGADLTVRDDRVYLKTVTGLRPVHGILRRLDDDYCDPLELRADSTLGVPGLVQAWRAGNVLVANAFGTSVLESAALSPFLPAIATHLLGEPLQLTSTPAWWSPDAGALEGAIARLSDMVIKPAFPDAGMEVVFGSTLDSSARRSWHERIHTSPERFVLEEYVPLSHAPVWHAGHLESRGLMLRVFLVSDGRGDYRVMDGGLSRIAGHERQIVSGQRGGSSKDTWVLSDKPVERVSLLPGRLRPEDIVRSERSVSSRAAEHLFWLGRYAERSENGARLLRAVLARVDHDDAVISGGSRPILASCLRHGLLPANARETPGTYATPHDFERELIRALSDPRAAQGVAFNVRQTIRVASAVRDRLSSDNWRLLNRLSEMIAQRALQHPGVAEAVDLMDQAIISLVAIGGLEMAHMTRDDGWRFLSLGRHLERLLFVSQTVADVAASETVEHPALLEWLLEVSDSIITYRARYMGHAEWLAVLDLLLFDPRNPRSAVFQIAKLSKHVPLLPDPDLASVLPALQRLAEARIGEPVSGDLFPRTDALQAFLTESEQAALQLSDALTLRFFSHVYESSRATLL